MKQNFSPKLAIYWHPTCEHHRIPNHPEQPDRVGSILKSLRENFLDASFREAKRVADDQILLAHHKALLQTLTEKFAKVETAKEKTGELVYENVDGGDTVIMAGTKESVYRAAGSAVQAVDDLFSTATSRFARQESAGREVQDQQESIHSEQEKGGIFPTSVDGDSSNVVDVAFCCVRPPGHHAEPFRSMGFCFVNNAVIAAEHARIRYNLQRVAILDFDVHHGNGTDEYARLLYQHWEQQQLNQSKQPQSSSSVFSGGFGAKRLSNAAHNLERFESIVAEQQKYYEKCHDAHLSSSTSSASSRRTIFPLFYASTHEREGYPGTGKETPLSKRTNIDRFIVNRNIPSGPTSREIFREKWLEIAEELVAYDPELVIFSAGFDAHDDDPLADVELADEDFYWVTRCVLDGLHEVKRKAVDNPNQRNDKESIRSSSSSECNNKMEKDNNQQRLKVMSILEGGYDLDAIARCAVEHIYAMMESFPRYADSVSPSGEDKDDKEEDNEKELEGKQVLMEEKEEKEAATAAAANIHDIVRAEAHANVQDTVTEEKIESVNTSHVKGSLPLNDDKSNTRGVLNDEASPSSHGGDEIAALQETLAEMGIQPPGFKR